MKPQALQRIEELSGYKPPLFGRSQYDGLLLDFNEKTAAPPDYIRAKLIQCMAEGNFQIYPDYFELEKDIAEYAGVSPTEVMVTNGSDHGIDTILRTFSEKGDKVIIPTPSFVMFHHFAQVVGSDIVRPLYNKHDLSFPLEQVLNSIDEYTRVVVVCNPNNPTGSIVAIDDVERIVRKAVNALVYVDEAYFEFSKVTAVELLRRYSNIVITRTFSKAFGLASFRIGYCIAHEQLIQQLLKVRGPYVVSILAYYAAQAALDNIQAMEDYVKDVMQFAKPLTERFFDQIGVPYFASAGNFILVRPDDANRTAQILADNGVLVRPRNDQGIENTLRITIGTTKQMEQFVQIYKKVVLNE